MPFRPERACSMPLLNGPGWPAFARPARCPGRNPTSDSARGCLKRLFEWRLCFRAALPPGLGWLRWLATCRGSWLFRIDPCRRHGPGCRCIPYPRRDTVVGRRMPSRIVLIADPAPEVSRSSKSALRSPEYRVFEARGGLEALCVCACHPVDLLLLAVDLPRHRRRPAGPEAGRHRFPTLRVLYLSDAPGAGSVQDTIARPLCARSSRERIRQTLELGYRTEESGHRRDGQWGCPPEERLKRGALSLHESQHRAGRLDRPPPLHVKISEM